MDLVTEINPLLSVFLVDQEVVGAWEVKPELAVQQLVLLPPLVFLVVQKVFLLLRVVGDTQVELEQDQTLVWVVEVVVLVLLVLLALAQQAETVAQVQHLALQVPVLLALAVAVVALMLREALEALEVAVMVAVMIRGLEL